MHAHIITCVAWVSGNPNHRICNFIRPASSASTELAALNKDESMHDHAPLMKTKTHFENDAHQAPAN
jgi:hypothetical protein